MVSDFRTFAKSNGWSNPPGEESISKSLKLRDVYAVFDDPNGIFDQECKLRVSDRDYDETRVIQFTEKLLIGRRDTKLYKTLMSWDKISGDEWVNEASDIRSLMPDQTRPFYPAAYMRCKNQTNSIDDTRFKGLIKSRSFIC